MAIFEGRQKKAREALLDVSDSDAEIKRKQSVAAAVARRFSKICLNGGSNNSRRQTALTFSKPHTSALADSADSAPVQLQVPPPATYPKRQSIKQLMNTDAFLAPIAATMGPSPTSEFKAKSKVTHERVLELWSIVRMHVIRKPPAMIQLLLASNAAAPYPLSIKQGFQFKYRLRTKYQIKCLIMHSRLPWHQPDSMLDDHPSTTLAANHGTRLNGGGGSKMHLHSSEHSLEFPTRSSLIGTSNAQLHSSHQINHGSKISISALSMEESSTSINPLEDHSQSHDNNTKHLNSLRDDDDVETKRVARLLKPSTFVCADTSRTIRMWDITRNTQLKPKSIVKLDLDVFEFVYLAKFSMYASCCDTKTIHFFNQRFEPVDSFYVEHYVQHLKYNTNLHELITIGSHEVYLWTLENIFDSKGNVTVKPTIKYKLNTNLPANEWITGVSYDEERHQMYVIVNTKVVVFDFHDGREVNRWLNISYRQINCVIYYEMYDYNIIGCANGAIKIINMTNAMVHEFNSHTRPITSLAIYPYGPIVISCSLDYSVRMYNLKTFKEVYCLHLKEKPTSMQIMDDLQLYISTWDTIMVWRLNHINTGFSTINTRVTYLINTRLPGTHGNIHQSHNNPPRILVRSEDGVIRLVSPVSGKIVTTSLPLLETDCVEAIAYCARIDRMFLLVETGEIWVVATNINPCVVVDIWSPGRSEDIRCIIMFEGQFNRYEELPPRYVREDGFAFLIAGTLNGQILFYGTEGQIVNRSQLHFAAVTHLIATASGKLVSGGEDCLIYISNVEPLSAHMITPMIVINSNTIPRKISILDNTICCSSDDHVVRMFSFNLETGAWQPIPTHNRSDDHTEEITSICNIELLGLFVTASRDSTIRIWDVYNSLTREIKFHEPLECLCVSNPRGDLLIGIQNRIDMIKFNLYLPPGYIKAIEAMTIPDEYPESPIQFDEKFDFLMNYMAQRRCHYTSGIDAFGSGSKTFENFAKLNFIGAIQPVVKYKEQIMQKIEQQKLARLVPLNTEDAMYLPIMEKLKTIMERRQKMIGMMKKQAERDYKEMEKKHNLLHQEFETFLRYKPYMGALYPMMEEKEEPPATTPEPELLPDYTIHEIEDYIPPDPLALVAAEEESPPPEQEVKQLLKGIDEFHVIESPDDPILAYMDPRSPIPVEEPIAVPEEIAVAETVITENVADSTEPQNAPPVAADSTVEPSKKEMLLPPPKQKDDSPKIYIAPDGEIPNSVLGKTVKNWKALHAWNNMVSVSLFKKGRTKGDGAGGNKDKQNTSEIYKAKLKKMMEEKEKREEEERRKREAEAGFTVPDEEVVVVEDKGPLNDEDEDEDDGFSKSKPRNLMKPLKPMEILRYPKLIDRAVGYSWFPVDEVLHQKTADDSETGLRRLKVENNADVIFPIVMDCFKTLTTSKERKEAIQYATWILEEYGIRDTTSMARTFMRYLQNTIFMKIDNEHEIELIHLLLESCTLFAQAQSEYMPTLLMLLLHDNQTIRDKAKAAIGSIGAKEILTAHIMKKLTECYNKALAPPPPSPSTHRQSVITHGSSTLLMATPLTPSNKSISHAFLPAATQDLFQNAAGADCRNAITALLRKTLKHYLMTATTDFELTSKLKGLNDHGYEDRAAARRKDDDVDDTLDPQKLAPMGRRKGFIQPQTFTDNGEKKKSGPLIYTSTPVLSELLTVEQVEPVMGDPIAILQNPSLKDFVTAMLFYARYNERRMVKEATDKSFKLEQELRMLEEARLKREHDAKLADFLKTKERERLRKLEERKAKMLALRNRARGGGDLPRIKKGGLREHLFTGCTHQSRCHPSRETLDGPLPKFPPLPTGFTTSMALHLATMNKSMPVENVQLAPFDSSSQLDIQTQSSPLPFSRPWSQLNRKPPTSSIQTDKLYSNSHYDSRIATEEAVQYLQTPHLWEGDQMQDGLRQVARELDYIRNGDLEANLVSQSRAPSGAPYRKMGAQENAWTGAQSKRRIDESVKTSRKYFILDLEEDIEKHKISGMKSKPGSSDQSLRKKTKKKKKSNKLE
ncbi:hypothetical protein BDR26DRAFT_850159 [Obelidium mucronatum]|nr:hypothetical protein BDR26DRAFT_850159 [Obelidium mucronatum]